LTGSRIFLEFQAIFEDMNEFLNQTFWDNPVKSYLVILGIIIFVIFLNRFISRHVANMLCNLVHKAWKNIDKKAFTGLLIQPVGSFLVIFISIVALHKLKFPKQLQFEIYKYTSQQIIYAVSTIVLIVTFTWFLLRIIDFIATVLERRANLTPDQSDNQLIIFFKDFFKVILIVVCVLMILKFAFSFNIGNLLTGLSIVGAAIALSLRESLENLIASFIIFFDKPFTTGDVVKVQNITGTVESIGLRSTRIRTIQKTFVTVPNKQMVDSIMDNLSLRTQLKSEVTLHVSLKTPTEKIELLVDELKKVVERKEIENATVLLNDITDKAFVILVEYFTAAIPINEFNFIKQEVNLAILKIMEQLEIEITGANIPLQFTELPKQA